MEKNAFISTMMEVLKYDSTYKNKEGRDQLIRLLGRAKANFLPQYGFVGAGIANQRWEIVELRFPVPLLDEANGFKKQLGELAEFVYEESEAYALQKIEIRPLVMAAPEEYKEYDVIFSEYRNTVIQGIRDAKFVIWGAVAWFTDMTIYQELLAKKNQGVSVRVIISREDQNNSMVAQLKNQGFDYKIIEHWGDRGYNRMHHKFCIIDMDYVMHGSYNWTPTANNNNETLATALDHDLVAKFASEFMLMYNEKR